MSYTDAEMLMASQVAYLNYNGNGRDPNMTVGDLVDAVLKQYCTYDSAAGTYVKKEGISGEAEKQVETAQNLMQLGEQNNCVSWRHWKVVDSCNKENSTGYYGCLIDTGDGNAIVGCRGSESYGDQFVKDWVIADVGRLNNELTAQQADATEYMEYLYKKYGDDYGSFSFTGHSLGGSLATHAAITAPEGMQNKIDKVISYDGPGFSDEYLDKHQEQIQKIKKKLNHYEYSWVGNLLYQPNGINNRVIKAHDDPRKNDIFSPQLWRHDTTNIEFDGNGNVMDGDRGVLQTLMGPISRSMESGDILSILFLDHYVSAFLAAYVISVADQVRQKFDEAVEMVKEKVNDLYNSYLSFVVSGDYEINIAKICRLSDDLDRVQSEMNHISDQVNQIRRNLPYDSSAALYYKSYLGIVANGLVSDGKKAKKISQAVDKAVSKYNSGDQKVSSLMPGN